MDSESVQRTESPLLQQRLHHSPTIMDCASDQRSKDFPFKKKHFPLIENNNEWRLMIGILLIGSYLDPSFICDCLHAKQRSLVSRKSHDFFL